MGYQTKVSNPSDGLSALVRDGGMCMVCTCTCACRACHAFVHVRVFEAFRLSLDSLAFYFLCPSCCMPSSSQTSVWPSSRLPCGLPPFRCSLHPPLC